jgi:two-component system sensor histidine kinase AlgZ
MQDAPTPLTSAEFAGTYPPSFCSWRLAVAVLTVSQLSVFMIGLGRMEILDWPWMLRASVYGHSLSLFCAAGICVTRPWLQRATPRGAWIATWLLTVLLTISWSYGVGVVATVLGYGPGRAALPGFMVESVLAVALVSLALFRYLYIRAQWRAEVSAQAEARVQALQARIRPHFLFNSLNTIASLIPDHPVSAEQATEDLADLFRGSMRRADRMIALNDELELASKFLDMERRRLGDRLQIEWRVEELPADAQVFPMILQPLLENAIGHGIQRLPQGGLLRVYGRDEEGSIVITVSNPVSAPPEPGHAQERHNGMALKNIRSRLKLAYGDRASLITQQDEQTYFSVLTLPHVKNPDRR